MGKTKNGTRYPEELRARAVRMVLDHESEYASRSAAILSISEKVGCSRDSLRIWVKQHETDRGKRDGVTIAKRDRITQKGFCLFCPPLAHVNMRCRAAGRSSTAHSANDCLHQGSAKCPWGRFGSTFRLLLRRESVEKSGAGSDRPSIRIKDRTKPWTCRSG